MVQGHRTTEMAVRGHDCAMLRTTSLRIILSSGAAYVLDVWSIQIQDAYPRSAYITPYVYVRPDTAFGVPSHIGFQIVRPIYGLSDAGDVCSGTLRGYLTDSLG